MNTSQELKKAAVETASAAAEYSTAALKDGLDRAQALLSEAQKQAGPVLKDARVRTADFASKRLEDLEPHLKDALDRVPPAVEAAKAVTDKPSFIKVTTMSLTESEKRLSSSVPGIPLTACPAASPPSAAAT